MYTQEELRELIQGTPFDENGVFLSEVVPGQAFMYFDKDTDYIMEAIYDEESGEIEDLDAIAPMVHILRFNQVNAGFDLLGTGDPYHYINTGDLIDGDIIMLISITDDTETVNNLYEVADENGVYVVMTEINRLLQPERYESSTGFDRSLMEEYVKSQGVDSLEIFSEDAEDDEPETCECSCCDGHHHNHHDEDDDDDDMPMHNLTLYSGTNILNTAFKYQGMSNSLLSIFKAVED